MVKSFIYNITFHCPKAKADELLKQLQKELIPHWTNYTFWHNPRLLRVHVPQEDLSAFSVQYSIEDLNEMEHFSERDDEALQALLSKFPKEVMPFSVLMQEENIL